MLIKSLVTSMARFWRTKLNSNIWNILKIITMSTIKKIQLQKRLTGLFEFLISWFQYASHLTKENTKPITLTEARLNTRSVAQDLQRLHSRVNGVLQGVSHTGNTERRLNGTNEKQGEIKKWRSLSPAQEVNVLCLFINAIRRIIGLKTIYKEINFKITLIY